ncbi:MAG: NADP-dependent phosphogluconate dehydrogenase, partial [Chromatiaceae bacterium]|nr:NADP-dependent phosphogluconate dehydrogenase [Chromatiaceae bacterium]
GLNLRTDQVAEVFGRWNQGLLESYLIEITAAILAVRDPDGVPRVDRILDSAGQKGTGQWTAVDALEQAIPLTLIGEAVNARFLSALKSERERAAQAFPSTPQAWDWDPSQPWVEFVHDALYAAKLVSYAQGFMLLRAASERFGWKLAYGDIALLWRGGCIIRSRFLGDIKRAFDRAPALENLLFDDFFAAAIRQAEAGWRRAVALGIQLGIPLPGFSSALAFYDGYRSARLPASLLQAQRDYFGAHTYARIDAPAERRFHTDWTGDQGERTIDE